MTLQFGVGGEYVIVKGIGVGAELGVVGVRQYFGETAMGVFSPNGHYHFVHGQDIKTDPFVTGGYTLMFRSGHAKLANFGGGMNYWFHRRLGVGSPRSIEYHGHDRPLLGGPLRPGVSQS
jgi:hypothetical protein